MKQQTKFKQTEIGKIPENWEVKSLEQVAIFKNGKSSPKRESLRNFPVYGSNGIIGFADETNSEDDTIIIGRVGAYCGSVYFSKRKCWVTDNAIIGNAKNRNSPQFLFYLMKKLDLNKRRGGSSQPLINQATLNSIKVAFATNESEQSAIAKILSDLDSKIELNQQMNKTLEAIGQAIFKKWFVDFEFPNEKGNPYKNSGGEMIDSELGEIPKGWKVGKLGDYVETVSGCSYTSAGLNESKNALVTLKSVGVNGFREEGFKEYTGEYNDKHIVKEGDIVVAHTDLTQDRIILGKPVIVRDFGRYKTMIASMDLSIIKPKKKLNTSYWFYFLRQEIFTVTV